MEDSEEYAWQLYPGEALREAYSGDAAAAGTYLFRDVSTYVIDPRDKRTGIGDDYKTKRLAGYRLRIDQDDLNALDEDYAVTVRNAFLTKDGQAAGQSIDSDSDAMTKPVSTTVLRQANSGQSAFKDTTEYYVKISDGVYEPAPADTEATRYVKVMDGDKEMYVQVEGRPVANPDATAAGDDELFDGTQYIDGTNDENASTLTYYLNEKGSQMEPGSFEDAYIVLSTIGMHSVTGHYTPGNNMPNSNDPYPTDELMPFEELYVEAPVDVTFTTTYRNETDKPQTVSITDPFPEGENVSCTGSTRSDVDGGTGSVTTDADGNDVVKFDGIALLPGESVTVTASYHLRTVKTIAHHAVISGGEEGDIETNTVSYKVKRDLDKLVPVLPLYQSSMLTATQLVNRETDESGAIKVVSQRTPTSTVGNYTGMTYLAAKAAIESAGLTLGRVTFTTDFAAAGLLTAPAAGTVVGQTPGAGLTRFGSQDDLVDPNIKTDDSNNPYPQGGKP